MCGIFGIISKENNKNICGAFKNLALLSESRGKEASGFAIKKSNKIYYYKTPVTVSEMLKSDIYKKYIDCNDEENFCAIGHSRLVTDGYEQQNINNQPVIRDGFCLIHNGIVVNSKSLWEKYKNANKMSSLDTELIPVILSDDKENLLDATKKLYGVCEGTISTAFFYEKVNKLFLSTNTGSLYYINDKIKKLFIFASEKYILTKLLDKYFDNIEPYDISQLNYGELLEYNYTEFECNLYEFNSSKYEQKNDYNIEFDELKEGNAKNTYVNTSLEHNNYIPDKKFLEHYKFSLEKINTLKRCMKCILPETFPFIEFNEAGVCNYCENYIKIPYKGESKLKEDIKLYKKEKNQYDCLLPFSGGRDSSYVMHYVKNVIGLRPLSFSYDWGMLTDLARRNQARMCGKLNVEHILISADIRKKRKYIKLNVEAWLKGPNLGTIPLFMAGDKKYFYYTNLLLEQNKLELSILGENLLETTNFKSGFCGIKPQFGKNNTYSMTKKDKMKMLSFYAKEFTKNTSYFNESIKDTLDAFKSYYVIKHTSINLFNYIEWDEKEIEDLLIKEYNWEIDPETSTTWRIGDGTAAFYNYIYYIVAGFTENDTFRSNQIREGKLNREEAIEMVRNENKPRWNSLKWYLNTIGLEFDSTIDRINKIPKLYE